MTDQVQNEEATAEKQGATLPATQEELNAVIAKRLERDRVKYAGFDEIKAKADRLDEIEDANKSELEKLQAQLAEANAKASAEAAERLRLSIASKHGIPSEHLDLLGSGSEEDLEARASKVAGLLAPSPSGHQRRELFVPAEGRSPDLALNSDGLLDKLKGAVGVA